MTPSFPGGGTMTPARPHFYSLSALVCLFTILVEPVRISIYCESCFRFVAYGGEGGSGAAPQWVESCDRCTQREARRRRELERLEQLWRARRCEGPGCSVTFVPKTSTQRFHDNRCRQRAFRRAKAATVSR